MYFFFTLIHILIENNYFKIDIHCNYYLARYTKICDVKILYDCFYFFIIALQLRPNKSLRHLYSIIIAVSQDSLRSLFQLPRRCRAQDVTTRKFSVCVYKLTSFNVNVIALERKKEHKNKTKKKKCSRERAKNLQ